MKKDYTEYIRSQENILSEMIEEIRALPDKNLASLQEIAKSIEILNKEAKEANAEDVPGIMYQLNMQHSLAEKLSNTNAVPDLKSPYFGHMKILQNNKEKDIYIGHTTFSSQNGHRIVDWKNAPIAKVFYSHEEGEEFDIEFDGRLIEGTLNFKAILTIHESKLLRVDISGEHYVHHEGKWINLSEEEQTLSGGEGSSYGEFGTGRTNYESHDVISLLDKTQYELVNRSSSKPLLIIGGAGSGKTTVALYRLARLCQTKKIYPNQALVVVPNQGLVNLSKKLLENVGLFKVRVFVLETFMENLSRKLIADIPKRINKNSHVSIQILKRHNCMVEILKRYVDNQDQKVFEEIKKLGDQNLNTFYYESKLPLIKKVRELKKQTSSTQHLVVIDRLFNEIQNFREDLFHIFSSDEYLGEIPNLSDNYITYRITDDVKYHAVKQMKDYDLERSYLEEEGSEDKLKNRDTIDVEDFPLLLNLIKIKNGSLTDYKSASKSYRHIVIDEAQELGDLELAIIKEFIHEKGNVTVAGDAVQQIDPAFTFSSWENVMSSLGYPGAGSNELNVSYRSPLSIVEFAHNVLGPLAPKEFPKTNRKGGPVIKTQVQHRAHASLVLSKSLRDLTLREPRASIAIICSNMANARNFFDELEELGNVRLVQDAEFNFKPGIDITCVEHIRGLEFDYVIIPDADREFYPDERRARKRLHLAATRSIHQLWVLHGPNKSPLF